MFTSVRALFIFGCLCFFLFFFVKSKRHKIVINNVAHRLLAACEIHYKNLNLYIHLPTQKLAFKS